MTDQTATDPDPATPRQQVAALCHRKGAKGREVLLVSSSRGRWILPKGWPVDGLSDGEAALQEAWEEGGVRDGSVSSEPLSRFRGIKRFDDGEIVPADIRVYGIKVRHIAKTFPESHRRNRRWVTLSKAAKLLIDKGYRKALKAI
ncbi:8-oxo-dGTP pyrophosphatase MutT, NUDIX family [Loktanella fryxellensis]|uniref:8-oxo-dGTP pyrophosphatase MutT, NUDIX family n=1 Tax=Loktanella fryxellensis TaxID=245187 RepID=A0A1H8EU73_9RHOB|nr:NUDIX hydrolase [Loktanella fryxellensis]SEN23032.1 8-oxo-dGTP pyrophosphatase MutT, NUDIX family [Loktanella fryxellensis]